MIRLLKYMRWYYWILIALIGIFLYYQVTLELMLPEYMNRIITETTKAVSNPTYQLNRSLIWSLGLKMVGLMALVMVIMVAVGYISARIAAGYSARLRRAVFQKVESFSLAEMSQFSTASLITRTTNDIVQLQMVLIMTIRLAFMGPLTGVKAILKVLERSSELSYTIVIAVLALVISIALIFVLIVPRFSKLQAITDRLNLVTRENLTGIRVVRAANAVEIEESKFMKANQDFYRNNVFVGRVASLSNPITQIILNGLSLAIVWLGAAMMNDLALEARAEHLGSILEFQQYAVQIVFAFMMMTVLVIFIPRGIVSGKRIMEIFKTENKITNPLEPKTGEEICSVEFRHVSFAYPDALVPVLDNISFKVSQGETLALIGSTGSGKSTIINLIPRFFDVTEGEVLVNGINVKDYRLEDLRSKIGYVPQKGVLFRGTIESNLTYGKADATIEEIEEALAIAQAKEFVDQFSDGIKHEIAQGGQNVSGGQRQRLSIARALIKKPEIYIFDDSFSALDFKTERLLREQLNEVTKNAIKIIVAQRISTIKNCERIVVLEQGKVVGMGTHKELLQTCQVYQEIALSQLSEEELG